MSERPRAARVGTWPYAVGGAFVGVLVVVLGYAREYEGGDAVVALGPLAAMVGALLGVAVSGVVRTRRRRG